MKHLARVNHVNLNIDNVIRKKSDTRALDATTSLLRDKSKRKMKWFRIPYLGTVSSRLARTLRSTTSI